MVLFWFLGLKAQTDSLYLSGKYYETNLYVFNPSVEDSFSISMLVVNGDTIQEELNSNAIEIDFEMMGFEAEQEVWVIIYFDSLFPAFVVNPEVLYSPTKFKFSKPRFRKEELSWRTYGDVSEYPIEVYQFRWNSWRLIATVDPLDTVEFSSYSVEVKPHSGENTFRLKTVNLQEEVVYSKEIKFRPPYIDEVFIKEYKPKGELEFSGETDYEIFSIDGRKLLEGTERYVNISSLDPGEYWVNYDNKTEQIKKK